MIFYTYNPWLVILSVLIALMASFTGLSLTRGLSKQSIGQRQLRIAVSAIALGGGIWSMHFVAILAMRFNVPVYFEVGETVASALIAILLAGVALLIMHFGVRSRAKAMFSGAILGIGIVAMHYVGLSAIEGCLPVYSAVGVALATVLAMGLGVTAITIAYWQRTERNTMFAAVVFGAAVTVVHFVGMWQTSFVAATNLSDLSMGLGNGQVALLVMLPVFVIAGAFLLVSASSLGRQVVADGMGPIAFAGDIGGVARQAARPKVAVPAVKPEGAQRLPYERDGRTHLVPVDTVYALRAEGHYTTAFLDQGPMFCPWSITVAEERLPPGFMRVHRSWLVNLALVSAYERAKDHGYCVMTGAPGLEKIPVSRSRIPAVLEALGL
jgi:diguanylate cyclase